MDLNQDLSRMHGPWRNLASGERGVPSREIASHQRGTRRAPSFHGLRGAFVAFNLRRVQPQTLFPSAKRRTFFALNGGERAIIFVDRGNSRSRKSGEVCRNGWDNTKDPET